MHTSPSKRLIDSNLNRLAEGLRVLEDIARMTLDDAGLTQRLKTLRHNLVRSDLTFNIELLQSRNSLEDVGVSLGVAGEKKHQELPLITVANCRRAQESLRVLEEMAKLPEVASQLDTDKFKKARFELYTLEKQIVSKMMRQDKTQKINGLYVIIDTRILPEHSLMEAARQVIKGGVKVIQLRDKTLDKRKLLSVAMELQALCRQKDVLFIINDYLDIALASEADGLHIGQEDLPVAAARRLLPIDKILGVSASTVEQARAAEAEGADYIAVGGIYPTASKDNVELVGVERIRQIKQAVKKPLVAIGGISESNTREVIAAGADSVCVISAVLKAPDITRAAQNIIKIIEAGK
jgi:thiamine-phosphate pyrophosphorylase